MPSPLRLASPQPTYEQSWQIEQQEVFDLLTSIWRDLLGLELELAANARSALDLDENRPTITSCVQLTGPWEGSVLLSYPYRLARTFASIMFCTEEENTSEEDIRDACGELANIAAGNIKKLLPFVCQLSLPSVVNGLDYHIAVPGCSVLSELELESRNQPLVVTVLCDNKNPASTIS